MLETGTLLQSLHYQQIVSPLMQNFHSEVNKLKRELSDTKAFFSAPELKLMILSTMFVILIILILVSLTYTIAQRTEYGQGIMQYSQCQLYGYNPNCMRRSEDKRIASNVFNTIATIAGGLIPYPSIFFILTLSDLKKCRDLVRSSWAKVKSFFYT